MRDELEFHRFSNRSPNALDFRPEALVIVGWSGRDRRALAKRVRELAALGVKRPTSMPVYYRVSAGHLTQAPMIQVLGPDTSGDVVPVLFSMKDGLWLGVGSDHADRKLEAISMATSKQACAKPVGGELWDCREIAAHWDRIAIRSSIIESGSGRQVPYQEGHLAQFLPPAELIKGYSGPRGLPVGTVLFCGSCAAAGSPRPARAFVLEIEDPVRERKLTHRYEIDVLPVVE